MVDFGRLFGRRGMGMNFRTMPMMERSDPGTVVVGLVRLCIARLVGIME